MRIYGVDFTSAPCKGKPITVACAAANKNSLYVDEIERLETFPAFEAFLRRPGPWIAGFDFPFGLARQSIGVGLGLSFVAMGFAAAGYIAPTVGALLQEAIDVAVILNALRSSMEVS